MPVTAEAAPQYCGGQRATIVGTWGSEVIVGTNGRDVIVGLGGDDTIYAKGGDDIVCGGGGNDSIHGGNGADTLFGDAGSDRLLGGGGDDNLHGDDGDDDLFGGYDNDVLNGGSGRDRLHGGGGNDVLNGGSHNDTLIGDQGHDVLNGDYGNDVLTGSDGNDVLNGSGGDDRLEGSGGDDILRGGDGADSLSGSDGNDVLSGGGHNDVVRGGVGNDRLYGDSGNDELHGGSGFDRLYGGGGADRLYGGSYPDFLNGGRGADRLDGGPGPDTYDWFYPETDTIAYLAVEDTVNMNWLSTTLSGSSELALAVPLYGFTALKHVRTGLRPYLRSDDILMLTSGNWSGSVDTEWASNAAAALRREFPSNEILLMTSGMENIKAAAAGVSKDVDAILYGYEPNMPNEPEFAWEFWKTRNLFDTAFDTVRAAGFDAGAYPTGRPILQKREWDWGWGSYGWDYGKIRAMGDHLIVQTQTYCAESPDRFAQALRTVNSQTSADWWPQITIAPGLHNAVPLWKGKACADRARWQNVRGVMPWWSTGRVGDMHSFLDHIGR